MLAYGNDVKLDNLVKQLMAILGYVWYSPLSKMGSVWSGRRCFLENTSQFSIKFL